MKYLELKKLIAVSVLISSMSMVACNKQDNTAANKAEKNAQELNKKLESEKKQKAELEKKINDLEVRANEVEELYQAALKTQSDTEERIAISNELQATNEKQMQEIRNAQAQISALNHELNKEEKRLKIESEANIARITEIDHKIDTQKLMVEEIELLNAEKIRLIEANEQKIVDLENERKKLVEFQDKVSVEIAASKARAAEDIENLDKKREQNEKDSLANINIAKEIARNSIWSTSESRIFDLLEKNMDASIPMLITVSDSTAVSKAARDLQAELVSLVKDLNKNANYKNTWTNDAHSLGVVTGLDAKILVEAKPSEVLRLYKKVMADSNKIVINNKEYDSKDVLMTATIVDSFIIKPTLYVFANNGYPKTYELNSSSISLDFSRLDNVDFLNPSSYAFGESSKYCRVLTDSCLRKIKELGYLNKSYEENGKKLKVEDSLKSLLQGAILTADSILSVSSSTSNSGPSVRNASKAPAVNTNPMAIAKNSVDFQEIAIGFSLLLIDEDLAGLKNYKPIEIPLTGGDKNSKLFINGVQLDPTNFMQKKAFSQSMLNALK